MSEQNARADARLAAVEALLPNLPLVDSQGMIHHGAEWAHGAGLQCEQCPGYPHSSCVSAAALRAALSSDASGQS